MKYLIKKDLYKNSKGLHKKLNTKKTIQHYIFIMLQKGYCIASANSRLCSEAGRRLASISATSTERL